MGYSFWQQWLNKRAWCHSELHAPWFKVRSASLWNLLPLPHPTSLTP